MAANKVAANFFDDWLEIFCNRVFNTPDVGDDGVFFEGGRELQSQLLHLPERRAKHYQVGIGYGFEQISRCGMDRASGNAFIDAALAPNISDHSLRQGTLAKRHPERPAQKPDPN